MSVIKDYRAAAGQAAEKVFRRVAEIKCQHSPVSSWAEMEAKRSITCSSSGSIVLQLAECLDTGRKIGHTLIKGTDLLPEDITSIDKAMYGRELLKHCRVIWVGGCRYKNLPVWLQRRGIVYIQWSNCCVSAGSGEIWSCNEEGGYHKQSDGSMRYDQYMETKTRSGILSGGGHYPWGGAIYVCIVPDDKWYQHYAVEAVLGMHGNGPDRIKAFGDEYEVIQRMVNRMCDDSEYFARWAADYVLEGYAGSGEKRKEVLGEHYEEVQEMVNYIVQAAHETWQGRHSGEDQRKKDFGGLYEIVQRQVNRTTR